MDFNIPPYYDDFDEDKKFLKVLFRPGYSLQARELSQLQSILQNQVSKVGDFIFNNKSRVIPGAVMHQPTWTIKLEPLEVDTAVNVDTFVDSIIGYDILGETAGVRGRVQYAEKSDIEGNPAILYYSIISGGSDSSAYFNFNPDEILTIKQGTTSYRVRVQNASDARNYGRIFKISPGVFYVNGYFVKNDEQTISLGKYTNVPSCTIGLDVVEKIITPEEDTSLLDNSVGAPNYTAPGAHRFVIDLVLVKREIGYAADNFIELMRIRNGETEFQLKDNDLSYLQDVLAKRTYDESGDYIVDPFEMEMREHRNSDQGEWEGTRNYQKGDVVYYINTLTNTYQYYLCLDNGVSGSSTPTHTSGVGSDGGVRWRYTAKPVYDYGIYSESQGGDTDKIAFGLKQGTAYIKGYEFKTFGTTYLSADKPREYAQIKNTSTPVVLGNLLDVRVFGSPDVDNFQIVDLYKVDTIPADGSNIGILVSNGANTASNVYSSSTTYWPNGVNKLTYVIVCATSQNYVVEKMKFDHNATTKAPYNYNGASGWVPYITTSKIGTARIRYYEPYERINSRTTAKISLIDIQMNPGEDFRKVRVIGTPLSVGSTSTGGDPNCFRALVLPALYNSTSVGSASVANSGGYGVNNSGSWSDMASNLTGQGTRWTSSNQLQSGDMVWFANDPSQFFFVRGLTNGSDTTTRDNIGIVMNHATGGGISGNLLRSDCAFENPQDYDSLFTLPKTGAYTIRGGDDLQTLNTSYTVLERYTASSTATDPVVLTISTSFPDEFVSNVPTQYVVTNQDNGESVSVTSLTLTNNTQAVLSLSASASISNSIGTMQNKTFTVYAPTKKRLFNAKEKVKSLKTSTLNIIIQSALEQETLSLFKADIFRLLKVEVFPNVIFGNSIDGIVSGTGIDITNQYELDNGQRDTHYDLGRLIKGKAFPFPSGPIRVTFEYFEHSAGDYLSVDSYSDLLYEEIPTYYSKVTGRTLNLKDVLDFRPRMNDAGTFDGGTTSSSSIPQRLYGINLDMAYFMSRKDSIILERNGGLKLIQGVPSDNPILPSLPSDTMILYDIDYVPYVNQVDALNVRIKEHEHKRYTMRDIGKIDKRVQNIEQVTALNLLEKETASMNIKDQDGLDRFKNGFVVDNFRGHTVGNPRDPDHECSIDIDRRELRPAFSQVVVDLVESASTLVERTNSNYRMHDENIVTLPYYTGAEYYYKNKNELATINAKGASATTTELFRKETLLRENMDLVIVDNPYATHAEKVCQLLNTQQSGIVALTPSNDSWIEEAIPPELVIEEGGTYDSVAASKDAFGIDFGTIWNGWQVTQLGTPITATTSTTSFAGLGTSGASATTTTTSVTTQQITETNTGKEIGLKETTGKKEINGRLTARQSISYVRSRPIVFQATGLKPSTRFYAFVDETPVSDYCTQATRLLLGARSFNYEYTPYQYGNYAQARKVYETFDTNSIFGSAVTNLERRFAGQLTYPDETTAATTQFTSVYNGDVKSITNLVNGTSGLNDVARDIMGMDGEVTAFMRGEVIIGETSGTTGIVVLHEQSTNSSTGEPDGLADVLHVVNIQLGQGLGPTTRRGGFVNGEYIRGTVSRSSLNGNPLRLQLRGAGAVEAASPGNLVSTGTGRLSGVWFLTSGQTINNRAAPKFLTGKRLFTLSDSATNDITRRTSIADTIYNAVGIIDAGNGSFVSVRNAELAINNVRIDRQRTLESVVRSVNTVTWDDSPPPAPPSGGGDGGGDGGGGDPLAQTFISTIEGGKDGCFVREVELFFKNKDSFLPVVVELRTVNPGGSPSETVIPFGRKVLYPSDIITDFTGTVGTVVRFPAPVHLLDSVRYAVVLVTVSPNYEVWTARLGSADVSLNKMGNVVKQPSLGACFISKNGANWVETPETTLKVNVFRCIFNTNETLSAPSLVKLVNREIEPQSTSGRPISYTKFGNNPFRVKLNSSEVIVTQPNHGFSVGSYVSFQNVSGSSNFGFSDDNINSYTMIPDVYDGATNTIKQISGFKSHQVFKVYSHDRYSIRILDSIGSNTISTATGTFGGSEVRATRNTLYTTYHPTINYMALPGTSVTGLIKHTSGKSPHGNEVPYAKDTSPETIILNDNNYTTTQKTILNKHNEAQVLGRDSSVELQLKLESTNKFVSPVIDLDRASIVCVQNRIDDPVTIKSASTNYYSATGGFDGTDIYQSEYENKEGVAQAAYITRKVQFKNSSRLLKVQIAANVPSNSLVDKTISSVTIPFRFASGARISDHPTILTQRTTASTAFAQGVTLITLQSGTGLLRGMYVYGPGIQKGTRISTSYSNGSTSLIIDKALKENLPATASSGTVLFFTSIDISSMYTVSQIDTGDYLSLPTGVSGITTGTYVTLAPKNSYFTRKVGTYSTGSFQQYSVTNFFSLSTLIDRSSGWIDATTNNMTIFLDNVSDIKVGTYAYLGNSTGNDGTFEYAPKSLRRVVQVNTSSKSIVLEDLLSSGAEYDSTGFGTTFTFNRNNPVVTFFDPRVRISQATTAAIEPTNDSTTGNITNAITFTTPPNDVFEVYAKTSTSGNATSTNAYTFVSSSGVASNTITLAQTHNLSLGSPITYYGENNVVSGLINGATYYAIVGSDFSLGVNQIKLASSLNSALAGSALTITSTSSAETHRIIDVNQKDAASIEDDQYFRILPDIAVGGDSLFYGNSYTLATKGSLVTTDNPNEFIDHSFTVDNLSPFNVAIIKIVMRSRNPAYVPKFRDLRIIATA